MANGDLAASIGITILAGTDDKRLGYSEINRALDLIAQRIIYETVTRTSYKQLDTTNSAVTAATMQVGAGKILGNNTATISEAVSFPQAFAAVPFVVAVPSGAKATGAFAPGGISSISGADLEVLSISTTGFTVNMRSNTSTFSSAFDIYYHWFAFGVLA